MPAIARLGDPLSCGDVCAAGSGNVFINGMPATRAGVDQTAGHGCFPPTTFATGSPTVFCNGFPLAVATSVTVPHCCGPSCHTGAVLVGSPDVSAG